MSQKKNAKNATDISKIHTLVEEIFKELRSKDNEELNLFFLPEPETALKWLKILLKCFLTASS
ncbi:hypothetical protein [Clostridium tyrobutyricum]|uniref:hypothetical protein n=1 Tax=Clostridium tyrobutyricum TaxID=1519 RepID=UPI0011CB866A|nr:hypothetical protein [Clostridium tyrobutyricum]